MNHTLSTIALSLGTLIPCQTKVGAKLTSRSLLQASATAPSGQVARSVQNGVDVTKPFDLLVQTPQGLHLVDFKTDDPSEDPEAVLSLYAQQLQTYRDLLAAGGLVGDRPIRCGLLLTATGSFCWL